jgi:hypothetical protein
MVDGKHLKINSNTNCNRMPRYNLQRHLDHEESSTEQFCTVWAVFATGEEHKLMDYITTVGH